MLRCIVFYCFVKFYDTLSAASKCEPWSLQRQKLRAMLKAVRCWAINNRRGGRVRFRWHRSPSESVRSCRARPRRSAQVRAVITPLSKIWFQKRRRTQAMLSSLHRHRDACYSDLLCKCRTHFEDLTPKITSKPSCRNSTTSGIISGKKTKKSKIKSGLHKLHNQHFRPLPLWLKHFHFPFLCFLFNTMSLKTLRGFGAIYCKKLQKYYCYSFRKNPSVMIHSWNYTYSKWSSEGK